MWTKWIRTNNDENCKVICIKHIDFIRQHLITENDQSVNLKSRFILNYCKKKRIYIYIHNIKLELLIQMQNTVVDNVFDNYSDSFYLSWNGTTCAVRFKIF